MRLKEQRDSDRLAIRLALWLRKDWGTFARGSTLELNAGGAQVELDQPLNEGSLLDVQLKVDGALYFLRARVVWVRPAWDGRFELGLAFLPSQSADLGRLRRWHHAQAPCTRLSA